MSIAPSMCSRRTSSPSARYSASSHAVNVSMETSADVMEALYGPTTGTDRCTPELCLDAFRKEAIQ